MVDEMQTESPREDRRIKKEHDYEQSVELEPIIIEISCDDSSSDSDESSSVGVNRKEIRMKSVGTQTYNRKISVGVQCDVDLECLQERKSILPEDEDSWSVQLEEGGNTSKSESDNEHESQLEISGVVANEGKSVTVETNVNRSTLSSDSLEDFVNKVREFEVDFSEKSKTFYSSLELLRMNRSEWRKRQRAEGYMAQRRVEFPRRSSTPKRPETRSMGSVKTYPNVQPSILEYKRTRAKGTVKSLFQ